MENKSVIIIGGGFAGLSAGIYARMNGYKATIFEMHDQPGGLCTAWKRKGYTIDGCIHWLVGSSPLSSMHRNWLEVGLIQGREILNAEEYMQFETTSGKTLVLYSDVDRLEKHLLEFSPGDREHILEFTGGIRLCRVFDRPSKEVPLMKRVMAALKLFKTFIFQGPEMKKWMNTTAADFADRFRDPDLRELIREMWFPEFSLLFMFFTFAWLDKKNAGYPVGGSLPMSEALEKRFLGLGGQINYKKKVEKILVENDRATGVRLTDGSEHYAERVISAADGYSTIFKMLDGKYADKNIKAIYEKWHPFPPLLFIGLGVKRTFEEEPVTVSGLSFPLKEPVMIGGTLRNRLPVHIYNQDPTLAPPGKTTLVVMLDTSYEYWKDLSKDRKTYLAQKEEESMKVITLLEQRFPGIAADVEMVDVATPMTFERYTGNWKGSFEGWLITPENSSTVMKPMCQQLPGLKNFYMCGQWVEPGGGLPTGVISARRLFKTICREDKRKFVATLP